MLASLTPTEPLQEINEDLHPGRAGSLGRGEGRIGGTSEVEAKVACTSRIKLEGKEVEVLMDTGSSVTLARESVLPKGRTQETREPRASLKSATGHELRVTHEEKLAYDFGGTLVTHWTYICPDLLHIWKLY